MQYKIAVGISLPTKLMEKIDTDRGDIPRRRYVLRILEKQYTLKGENVIEKDLLDRRLGTLQSSKHSSQ
jgi:hypothetical protein